MSPPVGRSSSGSPTSGEGLPARLILASASPRRREILAGLGLPFEVIVPEVEELTSGDPEGLVLENARRKAAAAVESISPGALVLAADTDVVLDGRVLGKPDDRSGARERLEALAGRTHTVLSGVVIRGTGKGAPPRRDEGTAGAERVEPGERSGVARSKVTFASLDEATIRMYLDAGEWHGRAGAYAIQGLGSLLVERVEGDFSNVVGLPLRLLFELAPELRRIAGPSAVQKGDPP